MWDNLGFRIVSFFLIFWVIDLAGWYGSGAPELRFQRASRA